MQQYKKCKKNPRERKDGKDERKKSTANHVSGLYVSREPARNLLGGVLKTQAAEIGTNLEGADGTVSGNEGTTSGNEGTTSGNEGTTSGNEALTPSEGQTPGGTEEGKLTVPQNLRVEGDYIVWDEVKDAYGYRLRTTINGKEVSQVCYETVVEIGRFFYEQQYPAGPNAIYDGSKIVDFSSYAFEVCAFDKSNTPTEYSKPVTVEYKASFTSPTNVRFDESEGKILWDVIEGTEYCHIRVFKDEINTPYKTDCIMGTSRGLEGLLNNTSGNYWISVQAMDKNYHVSEWTEPMAVSYTKKEKIQLKAPENLRLDENGNLLWDAVEGADSYRVDLEDGHHGYTYTVRTPQDDSWKTKVRPFEEGAIQIQVQACGNTFKDSSWSDSLTLPRPQRDELIAVPEKLWFEDGYLRWDTVDCSHCWWCIWANETLLEDGVETFDRSYSIGNSMPTGSYEVELFVVDENGNYKSQRYPVTLETVPDDTVWIPKIFCKFETVLWDYDFLRHGQTRNYWIRLREGDNVVRLETSYPGEPYFKGLLKLSDGKYTIDVCVCEYGGKIGNWSEPRNIKKYGNSLYDEKDEIITEVVPSKEPDVPIEDRITRIITIPAFNMKHKDENNNVELDLSEISLKAEEIYDEDALKRASEALGKPISGNRKYNLLDLTLLYKGEDFSNGYEGLVQVKIEIPKGHRDKTFSCYRLTEVDGVMTKELIPGEQTEDSYIIYLEHFSEYLLYGEGEGDEASHTHAYGAGWESDENSHWKECDCKATSEEADHTFGDWQTTKEATADADGMKERSCQVCGFQQTAVVPGLSHTHAYGAGWKSDGNSHWKECACKATSEEAAHAFGDWQTTREATADDEGVKERSCLVCGFKQTEKVEPLSLKDDAEEGEEDEEDDGDDGDTAPAGAEPGQSGARSPKTDGGTMFKRYIILAMVIGFSCLFVYFMLNIRWKEEP